MAFTPASEEQGAVLADDELLASGETSLRGRDLHMTADKAVHDLRTGLDHGIADDDRGLDVRPDDPRLVAYRCVRSDVRRGSDHAVLADHDGAADNAPAGDYGALLDPHPPCDLDSVLDGPLVHRRHVLEAQVVRLQAVLRATRVLPPSLHEVRLDPPALFPEGVNRVRDLELVPPRRLQPIDDREDRGPQQADSNKGEVRLRFLRFLSEAHDGAVLRELGDSEPLRLGHGTQ